MSNFARITPTEAKARLDGGWKPYVLDVRAPHEAEIATLAFSDRLQPHTAIEAILDELPKDRELLVYCRSGGRSGMACSVLAQHGFDCTNLEGGITRWAQEIDPSLEIY